MLPPGITAFLIVVCLGAVAICLYAILRGLRRGAVSVKETTFYRANDPFGFWFGISVYSGLALLMLALAGSTLM